MLNYFKNIYASLFTTLVGMRITFRHLFMKKVTIQYPNVHPTVASGSSKMPDNARNRIAVDIELCNGCTQCARICPSSCIKIETVRTVPTDNVPPLKNGAKRPLWLSKYSIDFAKCCFCGLCAEVCPTGAVKTTNVFEYSVYDRSKLLYSFEKMAADEVKSKKELWAKFQAEKPPVPAPTGTKT